MADGRFLLQVITASTRTGRKGPAVADWFMGCATRHAAFALEAIDLAVVNLPFLDEPAHPRLRQYEHDHTRAWSTTIDRADAFVFVTPEYDHGPPAALINALQFLLHEWAYKPAGFVSYGGVSGGTRSAQMTKLILLALKVMPMFESVSIPFFTQHLDKDTGAFAPPAVQETAAATMLDELHRWTEAMRMLRRR
ncbi:MAG TPA: NAD(P)H-dependent oxidoreductase [Gemmatimonadaceae bacterium]|nr:NAD(P)H-dependent oxidoreductase [Gemmatimonadaceae bacterium]